MYNEEDIYKEYYNDLYANNIDEDSEYFDNVYIDNILKQVTTNILHKDDYFDFGYFMFEDKMMKISVHKKDFKKYINILIEYCIDFEQYEYCQKLNYCIKLFTIFYKNIIN